MLVGIQSCEHKSITFTIVAFIPLITLEIGIIKYRMKYGKNIVLWTYKLICFFFHIIFFFLNYIFMFTKYKIFIIIYYILNHNIIFYF